MTTANFEGHHPARGGGEHRTVGPHRAWCHECHAWCYPADACHCCQEAPAPLPTRDEVLHVGNAAIRDLYLRPDVHTAVEGACRMTTGTLRAAVEKMRALVAAMAAEGTPVGPWESGPSNPLSGAADAVWDDHGTCITAGLSDADAAWIATMSPAIAEPLMDLLNRIADPTAGPLFRQAEALARAILGGEQ